MAQVVDHIFIKYETLLSSFLSTEKQKTLEMEKTRMEWSNKYQ
jgi:hypothetical protein